MRWILVAALAAFSSVGAFASETVSEDLPSIIDASEMAPGVIVSAIPAPAPVIEVLKPSDPIARAKSARKQLAKKKPAPTMMLSRTERRQLQVLVTGTQTGTSSERSYDQKDDSQGSLGELDFHRSYSRPKVVAEVIAAEDDSQGLSEHVRFRLLMARLKAVEAHALNQVQDDGEALSESVQLRLKQARLKAVAAHQQKFA